MDGEPRSRVADADVPEGVGDALDRIVDASQAAVADHARLAVLETRVVVARAIETTGFVFVAIVCFAVAWGAAMIACYLWARQYAPAPASALAPAAVSTVAGVVAAWASARRLRRVD
jgi:hypothetical protein